MKLLSFLLIASIMLNYSCVNKKASDKDSAMLMDSAYSDDKNITVLKAKDTIRLEESMKNFEDNPNIMQTDIDAGKRIESKEVQYVKKGDTLRIAEPGAKRK